MEDANSKLVGVVAFADVYIEESVDDRSVTAWQHLARFGNRLTTVFYLVVVFCILSVMPLALCMYIINKQVGNSQLGQMMVKHAAEQGCTIVNMVSGDDVDDVDDVGGENDDVLRLHHRQHGE